MASSANRKISTVTFNSIDSAECRFTPIAKRRMQTCKQMSVASLPVARKCSDSRYKLTRAYSLEQSTRRKFTRLSRRKISMRTAEIALRTFRRSIIIFDKADMCLCGLLSLSLSVHLICCIEVFFSMVLLIQAPDLLTMDGTYFYFLGTFDGSGSFFFVLHIITCTSCVVTAILLYVGSRLQLPRLLLPHIFWQICFILLSFVISTVLISLANSGKMLMPSSIVLSSMMLTGVFPFKIFAFLYSYRDELYTLFGISTLVAWLLFYLWALREYLCPIIFSKRHEDFGNKLEMIKQRYLQQAQLYESLQNDAKEAPESVVVISVV